MPCTTVHDVVALRETFVVVGRPAGPARPAVDTPAAGEVGLGDDRELYAGQEHTAIQRRDDDVHARCAQCRAGAVDLLDAVDRHTFTDEQLFDAVGRTAALGGNEDAIPAVRSRVRLRPSASVSPTTGSNAVAANDGVSGPSGEFSTGTVCALVCARSRSNGSDRRGVVSGSSVAPHVLASDCPSAASSSSSSCARSRSRRGSNSATIAACGQKIGEQMLFGAEPRQPRLHAVERLSGCESLPLLRAPWLRLRQFGGAGLDFLGREQFAYREDPCVIEIDRRALVGDRELREPIDLVAPQVDAHRMVGRRGIDVNDRAAHRELTARFHLVFAPIAHGHEPVDERVTVELHAGTNDNGFDRLHVGTESLYERSNRCDHDRGKLVAADPQPPDDAQATAHRLDRG